MPEPKKWWRCISCGQVIEYYPSEETIKCFCCHSNMQFFESRDMTPEQKKAAKAYWLRETRINAKRDADMASDRDAGGGRGSYADRLSEGSRMLHRDEE